MELRTFNAILLAVALSFMFAANSLAAEGEILLVEKTVSLKNLDGENVAPAYLRHIHISKDGNDLVISGDVEPSIFRFSDGPNPHVDVSLKNKNGVVVKTISAALRIPPGKYKQLLISSFFARFKDVLPDNDELVVQAKHHSRSHG